MHVPVLCGKLASVFYVIATVATAGSLGWRRGIDSPPVADYHSPSRQFLIDRTAIRNASNSSTFNEISFSNRPKKGIFPPNQPLTSQRNPKPVSNRESSIRIHHKPNQLNGICVSNREKGGFFNFAKRLKTDDRNLHSRRAHHYAEELGMVENSSIE